ncbi:MAG: AurF N-oxygenase family protein [Acidimicrobiales bacterium]
MARTAFDEASSGAGRGRTAARVERLSKASVGRGVDAFADIAWDDPEMAILPGDARLSCLPSFDPLADTRWYQSLPIERRGLVGAWRVASALRVGCDFENFLQQGLLRRALARKGDEAESRYAHHENIEESQHTLMFSEFIRRSGLAPKGIPWFIRRPFGHLVPFASTRMPALFFLLVLTGEEPIDRYQRRFIAEGIEHPLLAKVMRYHVADESRHVSFARMTLADEVAAMSWGSRQAFAVVAPFLLWGAALMMLLPPPEMARDLGVPYRTLWEPFFGQQGRRFLADMVSKPRQLIDELSLMTLLAGHVWDALGIRDEPS